MKTINLPHKLVIATAQYYFARDKQKWTRSSEGSSLDTEKMTLSRSKIPWNKQASLDLITESLPKGWNYAASSGTFWFSRPKGRTITVNENTWPNGISD